MAHPPTSVPSSAECMSSSLPAVKPVLELTSISLRPSSVGGVGGAVLIALGLFFYCRRRNKHDDFDEAMCTSPATIFATSSLPGSD